MFDHVEVVDVMNSNDMVNLELLKRPELGVTFTKIHCWRLVRFQKCVFLDADCLVMSNVDELFERDEFSAAADVGWPDCFNSGVFVFKPSVQTYSNILHYAVTQGSFDGKFPRSAPRGGLCVHLAPSRQFQVETKVCSTPTSPAGAPPSRPVACHSSTT